MPAEAARREDVGALTGGRGVHAQRFGLRIDDDEQGRVGYRRPDQPGTRLVDGQPQIGHCVEIEVLERAYRGDEGAQDGQFSSEAATRSSTACGLCECPLLRLTTSAI